MFWLWMIGIGLLAGLTAGAARRGSPSDLVGYVVLGMLGSVIGGNIFVSFAPYTGFGPFIAAAAGAFTLIIFIEIVKRD